MTECQNGLFPSTHCDGQPTRVPGLTEVTALSAGRNHTCALNPQGLWCWGDNGLGELGVEGDPADVPTLVEQAAGAIAIDSSDLRSCALLDTDEAVCWGVQVPSDESVPALFGEEGPVPSMERVSLPASVGVTAGATFGCVNDAAGAVQCWGDNALGELGDGEASRDPRDVSGIDDAVHIAAGPTHACAAHDDGGVSCWGASPHAPFGPARGPDARPVRVALSPATRVAAGEDFTCAVVNGGRVECFGLGTFGQIGSDAVLTPCDPLSPSFLCGGPAEIPGIDDAIDVVAGARHACALRQSGEVVCWGSDFQQQLGDGAVAHASCPTGNTSCSAKPVRARNLVDVRALALGEEHSCALNATGRIACWGSNREGRVGLDATLVNEPTTLPAPTDASALAAGLHTCAADRQGDVWCWGQPGAFSGSVFLSFERMPTRVEGFERIVTVALGNDHLCGVNDEAELYCMGRDDLAQLANTGHATAPRRIDAW